MIQERRAAQRYAIAYQVLLRWTMNDGTVMEQTGMTENVGPHGCLVYIPRNIPPIDVRISVEVFSGTPDVVVSAGDIVRIERNAAHPQVALNIVEGAPAWEQGVWKRAAVESETLNVESDEDLE